MAGITGGKGWFLVEIFPRNGRIDGGTGRPLGYRILNSLDFSEALPSQA